MSTYTKSDTPLTIVRGAPWSIPFRWQDPDGVAINITGFTIAADIEWTGGGTDGTVNVTDAVGGLFTVGGDGASVAEIPEGRLSELTVVITDTAAQEHIFDIPIVGQVP